MYDRQTYNGVGNGGEAVECRRCQVVCERVVHPVHCLRRGCPYTYAFTENGVTFFGCVDKVFSAELDLGPYLEAPRRDPYGALKVKWEPRGDCAVSTAKAYAFLYSWRGCRNHTFGQTAKEYSAEVVRSIVEGTGDSPE